MSKKIIAAVLAAVLIIGGIIGGAAGGKAYSLNKASHPQFTEKNVAENAKFTKVNEEPSDKTGFKKVTLNKGEYVDVDFGKNVTFDSVVLKEKGDNVTLFRLYQQIKGEWVKIYEQDRILDYRMCTFEPVIGSKLRIEIVDCLAPVTLKGVEAYRLEKSKEPVKVSQYLSFGANNDIIHKRDVHDSGFSGYYNIVTDVIVFEELSLDKDGNIVFNNGEKSFGQNLQALKEIIGEREVKIWATVRFEQRDENGGHDLNAEKKLINKNRDAIVKNIKAVVDKYGLYGVDFDWEYPETSSQWKAYSKLITSCGEQMKVSVALPNWGIGLSNGAVKAVEHVNVMTYDMFDERGDHSNIVTGTVNAVKSLVKAGFEKNQILLGIPAYGRTTDKSENAWPTYSGNEMKLGKFNKILKDYEYTNAEGQKVKSDAYIQSFAEARDRTKFAMETGVGGVMIFQASCDSPYTYPYSLHRAVNEAVNGKTVIK